MSDEKTVSDNKTTETSRPVEASWMVLRLPPSAPCAPRLALMGRGAGPLGPGEPLLPTYFALHADYPSGLLGVPSPVGEGNVTALYPSKLDASRARAAWFARVYGASFPQEEFPEAAEIVEVSAEEALEIRRWEAKGRGDAWAFLPPAPTGAWVGESDPGECESPLAPADIPSDGRITELEFLLRLVIGLLVVWVVCLYCCPSQ
jgi:hypothetical protein